jgi:hypothetical protein
MMRAAGSLALVGWLPEPPLESRSGSRFGSVAARLRRAGWAEAAGWAAALRRPDPVGGLLGKVFLPRWANTIGCHSMGLF